MRISLKLLTAVGRLSLPTCSSACTTQFPVRAYHCSNILLHESAESKALIVAMPMLSPTMTEGALLRWNKNPGDQLEPYDLLFELETESLTEEAYRLGDFAGRLSAQQQRSDFSELLHVISSSAQTRCCCSTGKVGMQIECVEDAYFARQLVAPGAQSLPVGTPIGILCENEEDMPEVAKLQLPTSLNAYNSKDTPYRFATWQSYLKERKVEPTGSCM